MLPYNHEDKKGTQKDADQILILAEKFATIFSLYSKEFHKTYACLVKDKNASLLVAETNDLIIGYCLAFHHLTFFLQTATLLGLKKTWLTKSINLSV
jgi:hypothetical protein